MVTQNLDTIIGKYNPSSKVGPRLELSGPFNEESIDALQKFYPYTFWPKKGETMGDVKFMVNNERHAMEMVKTLNAKLAEYNLIINYTSPENIS